MTFSSNLANNSNLNPNINQNNSQKSKDLFIGEGVVFDGKITVPGKAEIHGTVTGEIKADSLLVGKEGKLTGISRARSMDIIGQINQEIFCEEHLHIRASGIVSGKLEYSEMEIERGGKFAGSMNQITKGK
jgi:cytoskeletal protein CcmA (bactofilin family)